MLEAGIGPAADDDVPLVVVAVVVVLPEEALRRLKKCFIWKLNLQRERELESWRKKRWT